jgi:hypothetical protein
LPQSIVIIEAHVLAAALPCYDDVYRQKRDASSSWIRFFPYHVSCDRLLPRSRSTAVRRNGTMTSRRQCYWRVCDLLQYVYHCSVSPAHVCNVQPSSGNVFPVFHVLISFRFVGFPKFCSKTKFVDICTGLKVVDHWSKVKRPRASSSGLTWGRNELDTEQKPGIVCCDNGKLSINVSKTDEKHID